MTNSIPRFLLLGLICISACDLSETVDEAIVTVSGNISDDGQPVSGALVLLVDSPDSTDGISLSNGSITGSNGDYTILGVKPGTYYVMAVDDANDNLQFDIATDRLGFYGINPGANDPNPDAIVVTDDDRENIDIKYLYSLSGGSIGIEFPSTPSPVISPQG